VITQLSYKSKQFFIAIIKLSIIVGASYYIYNRLLQNENLDFSKFVSLLTKTDAFSTKNVFFLLILTFFNWFFEIIKWKCLVHSFKKISFRNALEQSLGGLTASLITPNRIGDYGAKAVYYPRNERKKIIFLNLLSNISQMGVTTLFGTIGLAIFYNKYNMNIDFKNVSRFLLILIIVGVFSFFGLKQSKFKIKGIGMEQLIAAIKNIPKKTHRLNFIFSLLRYCIFSYQFYFLLLLFGVSMDFKTAIIAISSMYFLASIVPSLAAFDVLIKTSAAVFLFGILEVNELTILSITTLMWLLNFIFPSFFGSYFVLNFKLPKFRD